MAPPSRAPCKFYARGTCRDGNACRFPHVAAPAPAPAFPLVSKDPRRAAQQACAFFARGRCKYGTQCRFRHVPTGLFARETESGPVGGVAAGGASSSKVARGSTRDEQRASEELDRLRRQVESLEIENAELRTRQSLETPVMPLNAASRIGWTCVLPIELVLKIGEWLPAGSKTLATFMLSCRAMYGLLLRHHRNVVCTESLATRARLDQRIHQLASAGTLEKVKELRMSRKGTEDSVPEEFDPEQWPDADVAFRLMAESCPNLERLQCSLQLGYMPALFATLQLGKLALLDLAFTDSRFSGGTEPAPLPLTSLRTLILRSPSPRIEAALFFQRSCPSLERVEYYLLSRSDGEHFDALSFRRGLSYDFKEKIKVWESRTSADLAIMLRSIAFAPEVIKLLDHRALPLSVWRSLCQRQTLREFYLKDFLSDLLKCRPPNLRVFEVETVGVSGGLEAESLRDIGTWLEGLERFCVRGLPELLSDKLTFWYLEGGDFGVKVNPEARGYSRRVKNELQFWRARLSL